VPEPDVARHPVPVITVLASGLAVGLLSGTFGVGGGVLLVPLLVLVMRRTQHVAHATSLVAITVAALSGLARFATEDAVAYLGAAALAVGAVGGARLGGLILPKISEGNLRRAFAVLLGIAAIRFLVVGAEAGGGDVVPDLDALTLALHVVGGVATGVASAVFGVGGGVVMVPLMVLGFGYGQHVAEGTSLLVIIPTALTGAIVHHRNGYTDWSLGWRLGLARLVGGWFGASFALSLDADVLTRLFGALMLIVCVLMLRRDRQAGTATE
jgi:uncharacterized protein